VLERCNQALSIAVSSAATPFCAGFTFVRASSEDLSAATGDGAVADYIPALASASPELFGICVVGAGPVLRDR
jgi:hypothetical protein